MSSAAPSSTTSLQSLPPFVQDQHDNVSDTDLGEEDDEGDDRATPRATPIASRVVSALSSMGNWSMPSFLSPRSSSKQAPQQTLQDNNDDDDDDDDDDTVSACKFSVTNYSTVGGQCPVALDALWAIDACDWSRERQRSRGIGRRHRRAGAAAKYSPTAADAHAEPACLGGQDGPLFRARRRWIAFLAGFAPVECVHLQYTLGVVARTGTRGRSIPASADPAREGGCRDGVRCRGCCHFGGPRGAQHAQETASDQSGK